jgi:hypothetical protein
VVCLAAIAMVAVSVVAANPPLRFATFNASLYRHAPGELIADLDGGADPQARVIAEIIQRVRPDVLLINEFDYDEEWKAARIFLEEYVRVGQNGVAPIHDYEYLYVGPSNTGVPSGLDLDNNGNANGLGDMLGYGEFEGQYGMVLYSRYPILEDNVRTFQFFRWADMPGALLPDDLNTPQPADWFSLAELNIFRLSSKSHWDIPIATDVGIIHVLACHPTPPIFDGPQQTNARRNHDEIRFWADYVTPGNGDYIYDDNGDTVPLEGEFFVVMGDMNADPCDGDSAPAIHQLLANSMINVSMTPAAEGGAEQADLQMGVNLTHQGDPIYDTADFGDVFPACGNLRVDYVLPSITLEIIESGIFWPVTADPLFSLVGIYPFPGSDHRLVWVDLVIP